MESNSLVLGQDAVALQESSAPSSCSSSAAEKRSEPHKTIPSFPPPQVHLLVRRNWRSQNALGLSNLGIKITSLSAMGHHSMSISSTCNDSELIIFKPLHLKLQLDTTWIHHPNHSSRFTAINHIMPNVCLFLTCSSWFARIFSRESASENNSCHHVRLSSENPWVSLEHSCSSPIT